MGTTTKTEKTEKKTSVTKPKTVKKGWQRKCVDLDTFVVNGSELAQIFGVAQTNLTKMEKSGVLTKDEDGFYNLRDNVSAYMKRQRELRQSVGRTKSDIETETAQWKLDLIKQKSRDWRMQRDRECALEILHALANAVSELKEEAKMNPALVDAFDHVLSKIEAVNVDSISLAVEGEEEEEDEI